MSIYFFLTMLLPLLVFYGCDSVSNYVQIGKGDESLSDKGEDSKVYGVFPDIFIVAIDSLRADHVGTYGYHRNTTPFIDLIAKRGLVFEKAYSPSSFTRESVCALFTGKYPSSTSWGTGWMAQIDPGVSPLSECLSSSGYQTFLYTDNPVLVPEIFGRGFQFVEYYTDVYDKSGNGDKLVEKFIGEVSKAEQSKPIFVYFHFYDPHHPYDPAPSYYLSFANRVYPNPLSLYKDVRPNLPQLVKQGFGPGEERFEDLVLRYDAEILMVDHSVKKLYESVAKLRNNRKAIWIITADHGEEFLDHGFVEHAWRLYLESIHVPLILHITSEELNGRRIKDEVSLVDIYPTLVNFLSLQCRNSWEGLVLPLEDWIKGGEKSLSADRVIISELIMPTRTIGVSFIKNGWQYLCWYKWLTVEQSSEYSKIQKELITAYEKGEFSYPIYCSDPIVYEEFISPDEKGYPKNFITFDSNKTVLSELFKFRENWCATRPKEKNVDDKKKNYREIKIEEKGKVDTESQESDRSDGETDFDPLKHGGYF
ncbi:MAG: sulfatase [Candidatus Hydrogenedentes bacterium]|nr:sulfatase [Candidatus Hydrogenedentota bacterium]